VSRSRGDLDLATSAGSARSSSGSARTGLMWILLGDGAAKVALIGTSAVALLALNVGQFGVFAGLQAAIYLSAAIWDFGSGQLLTREIAGGRVPAAAWLGALAHIRLRTLPLWLGSLVGSFAILGTDAASPVIYAIGICASLLIGLQLAAISALRGRMDFRGVAKAVAAGRWAGLGAGVALVLTVDPEDHLHALLIAWLAGELLGTMVALHTAGIGALRNGPKLSFKAAAPLALNSIVQIGYNRFDLILVAALSTPVVVGAYATASRIQDAMLILPSAGATIVLPFAARLYSHEMIGASTAAGTRRLLTRTWLAIGLPSLALALCAAVLAPTIVTTFLGPNYQQAIVPIQVIAVSIPLVAVNSALASVVVARHGAGYVTSALLVALTTVIAMNVALVPVMGAVAPALAATVREVPVLLVLLIAARRVRLFGGRA